MLKLDAHFFKTWRESWRTHPEGRRKEERIKELEDLVKNNILKHGPKSHKEVLAEVVKWKYGEWGQEMAAKQREKFMSENDEDEVREVIKRVLDSLKDDPSKVFDCIWLLKENLKGARIPVASAFLRFLDPENRRYGVIDRNVAKFLNDRGFTNFEFSKKGYIRNSDRNLCEYQKYHDCLQKQAKELEGVTYTDIDGKQQPFRPVDVERAIFLFI